MQTSTQFVFCTLSPCLLTYKDVLTYPDAFYLKVSKKKLSQCPQARTLEAISDALKTTKRLFYPIFSLTLFQVRQNMWTELPNKALIASTIPKKPIPAAIEARNTMHRYLGLCQNVKVFWETYRANNVHTDTPAIITIKPPFLTVEPLPLIGQWLNKRSH